MVHPLERRIRWIRSMRSWRVASSKLINVNLTTRAFLAFLFIIIPVSALILLQYHSLTESASSHTESNFSNVKDFNLLESLSLRQHQKTWRSLLQERATPTGFPPPVANGHVVVSQVPDKYPPSPPPRFLYQPPPLPP